MPTVEKLMPISKSALSCEEIRLCEQMQKLVREVPDEKKRFRQIDALWDAHIQAHPTEREWDNNAKAEISLAYLIWSHMPQVQGCSGEELAVFIQNYIQAAITTPMPFVIMRNELRWIFKGYLYKVNGQYSIEQQLLLVMEAYDQEQTRWDRLKQKYTNPNRPSQNGRPSIPEEVRIEVWRRDGGKCVRCGSRENLEYDHIIPVSKGGSNTVRNIELLCGKCNREKGANIQ